jgi:ubiquinone/menaquinone biosynthesis C-methylase UbiE
MSGRDDVSSVNHDPSAVRTRLWVPPRRFDECNPELVDRPDADPVLLRGELRNLRIINRYLGGLVAVRRALMPMIMSTPPGHALQLLDLATGSGDQAVAIARVCRRLGRRVVIVAVDNNDTVLADARDRAADFPEIRFEHVDIRALTFSDRSFDVALCSLAIHHLSWTAAVRLLQEMDRICRIGFVLSDLSRSRLALACAWLYTRATTTNMMTRIDAIASVFAAYTKGELAMMAQDAGVGPLEIRRAPFFRLVAVKRKA